MEIKKIAAVLLALANTFCLFACGTEEPKTETDAQKESGDTAIEETEQDDGYEKDNLPDDLSFDGAVIYIGYSNQSEQHLDNVAPDQKGETVSDSIFFRNLAVEERLKVDLEPVIAANNDGEYADAVRTSVTAGMQAYHFVDFMQFYFTYLITENVFYDVSDLQYMDFDKPWWATDYVKQMSIDGSSINFIAGDHTNSMMKGMSCIYYNKVLYTDYIDENPDVLYQTVLDGKWTLDELARQSALFYKDTNGNGEKDNEDVLGYGSISGSMTERLIISAGNQFSSRDENGFPVPLTPDEMLLSSIDKLIDLNYNNEGILAYPSNETGENIMNHFMGGTAGFLIGTFTDTDVLRDMENNYGIIPYPKYDESIENYGSAVADSIMIMAVPTDCPDHEMTGAVLEALASEGYRSVLPLYYESVLKQKYSRDETSSKMIDLIHDNPRSDFMIIYSSKMNNPIQQMRDIVRSGNNTYVSAYKRISKVATREISNMIAAVTDS